MTLIEVLEDFIAEVEGSQLYPEFPPALAEARALIAERDKLKAELQAKKKEHTARYIATLKAHAEAMAGACKPFQENDYFALRRDLENAARAADAYRRDFPEER